MPFINTQAIEVVTSAGQPTTLSIEPGGNPPPEVQWFKDGNPVTHHILSDGSLYMSNTSLQDSGNYTVKVTNSTGQSQEVIRVDVLQPMQPEGTTHISHTMQTHNHALCLETYSIVFQMIRHTHPLRLKIFHSTLLRAVQTWRKDLPLSTKAWMMA